MTPVSGDLDQFGLPAGGSKFDDLPNEAEPAFLTLSVAWSSTPGKPRCRLTVPEICPLEGWYRAVAVP